MRTNLFLLALVLALPLAQAVPQVTDLESNVPNPDGDLASVVMPAAPITYYATFADVDPLTGETTALITPEDGGSCSLEIFDMENPLLTGVGFGLNYNSDIGKYEGTYQYKSAGTYRVTARCLVGEEQSSLVAIQAVYEEPTQVFVSDDVTLGKIRGAGDDIGIYASYMTLDGTMLTNNSGAGCGFVATRRSTGAIEQVGGMEFDWDISAFRANVQLPASGLVMDENGNSVPDDYVVEVNCGGVQNVQPSVGRTSFIVRDSSCRDVRLESGVFNLQEDMFCDNSYVDGSLFVINYENDVVLDCAGHALLSESQIPERAAVEVVGGDNITIQNCRIDKYGNGIKLNNATNVRVYNVTMNNTLFGFYAFSMNDTQVNNYTAENGFIGFMLFDSNNLDISDSTVTNSYVAAVMASSSSTLSDMNFNNLYYGMVLQGVENTFEDMLFENISFGTLLVQPQADNNTFNQIIIRNSSIPGIEPESQYPAVAVMGSNNTFTSLIIERSGIDGLLVEGGSGNTFTGLMVNGTNRTGVHLASSFVKDENGTLTMLTTNNTIEGEVHNAVTGVQVAGSNNRISLRDMSGNELDVNVSDSFSFSNYFYGNNYLDSLYFNVTSNNTEVVFFETLLFGEKNGNSINFTGLNLTNSTGELNLSRAYLANWIVITPTYAFVNSSAFPFLNREAEITLTGVSYSSVDAYRVLKDGSACDAPSCVKLASNPVKFRVLGFSNYTTEAVETPANNTTSDGNTTDDTTTSSPAPASTPAPGSLPGFASPPRPPANNTANNTRVNATTPPRTTPAANATLNNTRPANATTQGPVSPLTGLLTLTSVDDAVKAITGWFSGVGNPLSGNEATAAAGVALVVLLLAAGYVLFVRK